MINNNEVEIAFYRGNAVRDMLKKFELSNDEYRIITAAILTSKKQTPDMKIIAKANKLLKHIEKTKKHIKSKKQLQKEALARMDVILMQQKVQNINDSEPLSRKLFNSKISIIYLIGVLLSLLIYNTFYKKKPVIFEEAKKICESKGKVLPKTENDFLNLQRYHPYNNSIGYWTSERKFFYSPAMPLIPDDGQKHYVKCLEQSQLQSNYRY